MCSFHAKNPSHGSKKMTLRVSCFVFRFPDWQSGGHRCRFKQTKCSSQTERATRGCNIFQQTNNTNSQADKKQTIRQLYIHIKNKQKKTEKRQTPKTNKTSKQTSTPLARLPNLTNQPTTNQRLTHNQSINQPTNQRLTDNQSINQPTNQRLTHNQSINQPTNQRLTHNQPINQPINA